MGPMVRKDLRISLERNEVDDANKEHLQEQKELATGAEGKEHGRGTY
jgi:hypothetical protein